MGCVGISSCFVWQGERQPESLSLLLLPGFLPPPLFPLLITSQEISLFELIWGLAGELIRRRLDSCICVRLKENFCAQSQARRYLQPVLIFLFSFFFFSPHEQFASWLSDTAEELLLCPPAPQRPGTFLVLTAGSSSPAPAPPPSSPETLFVSYTQINLLTCNSL